MIHTIDLHFQNIAASIAAFLMESDGELILVETGPHSTLETLKAGIQHLGYRPEDVKHVLLTHIHLDHAGAAWAFAEEGATIYVHPFGARHLASPGRLMESARQIYQSQMDSLWGQMNPIPKEQLITMEHGQQLNIGALNFTAWHTPGHAVHHIAWQFGDIVFSGDVAGVKIRDGIVVPPCPPPDINIEDWKTSIELLRSLNPAGIYLTHFGEINNARQHLDELELRLDDWASWIYPFFEMGKDPKSVVPAFEKYVAAQLTAAGLDEHEIRQYETANPSWMSVYGLMRYWEKVSVEK